MTDSNKHSSLLQHGINNGRKMYRICLKINRTKQLFVFKAFSSIFELRVDNKLSEAKLSELKLSAVKVKMSNTIVKLS
jgi:hypothetical protein